MTAGTFSSMIYTTQYRLPDSHRWLMGEADHARGLPLSPKVPAAFAVQHVRPMAAEEAGAPVGTRQAARRVPRRDSRSDHRDPLIMISSMSALCARLQKLASDGASVRRAAGDVGRDDPRASSGRSPSYRLPHDRARTDHRRTVRRPSKDPFSTIGTIYARLGRDSPRWPGTSMRAHLAENPDDGGGSRYRWADTGLDAAALRERIRAYRSATDVPSRH